MEMPVGAIRAFLDSPHLDWAGTADRFARSRLRGRAHPESDEAGRLEARRLLALMGDAGLYRPIADQDLRACCLARESIAAASPLADAVWALQGLGVTPILKSGSDALVERYAKRAVAGELMSGFAMTEEEAGSNVASLKTTAVRDGDEYVLSGEKWFISNAGIADYYVVFASTDLAEGSRGISAFVVPADRPGVTFFGAQVMSAPHPMGKLRFDECRVPDDHLLGVEGGGFKIGMATLDMLRPTVGAAAAGMASRAIEEALAHATGRRQFGKALSEFQLIQAKLGRMAMDLTASRLLVYQAAWRKDSGQERITTEAAMAKAYATESAQTIIDDAVQILGGRGVLSEHPVELLYRSIRALRIYEGTTDIQHLIIGGQIITDFGKGAS